ncbi:DUF1015 family protein [Actinopolymorpha cephalotaxi]|uniref:Uncharacterized protein (DUF1015 family) n=1 Tax=Actinopolymorpha cephalotaxi TaxID=504797 RepID=A0ABX2S1L7_9ACTN|nr:DUF1015 domain-containing protein [Actinopolymorpha cephalotaxi]NYH83201.1 uncharacterized protein (DUF1015 family) [Actinopolymorpha cephalotaxi]
MTDPSPTPGTGARPLVLSPFVGVRYDPERVSDLAAVTSPPYDVLDPGSVTALTAEELHNIVRVVLPRPAGPADWTSDERSGPGEGDPSTTGDESPGVADSRAGEAGRIGSGGEAGRQPGSDPDQPDHYRRAAGLLNRWRAEGILRADTEAALYVYEQRVPESGGNGRQQFVLRGMFGAVALREPEEGVILPHEDVMPGPVADRLALMSACEANLEPILLVYDGGGPASDLVEATVRSEPLVYARTADGVDHQLWRITDPGALSTIAADLAPRQALIADGHHRYASYLKLQRQIRATGAGPGPWDSGLALLVDQHAHPLRLTAIHRTVAGITLAELVTRAGTDFAVESFDGDGDRAHDALAAARGRRNAFVVTDGLRWDLLSIPAETTAGRGRLDTEVLHDRLFGRILGLAEEHIGYAHSERAAVDHARNGHGVAVLLNPVDVATVQAVAREGGRMPRKSTSFGPKPRTGFVMRMFDQH